MSNKLAVVTGGNKGIGYAIVKGLCEKYQGKVYLTSRDETRGREAVEKLKASGLNPSFHQLDTDDQLSVDDFMSYIKENYDGIDVLINNAGVAFSGNSTVPFGIQAEETIKTNYYGVLKVCDTLFKLLKPNANVIIVSSALGHLSRIPSKELRERFSNPELKITELSDLMEEFIKSAKNGTNAQDGWGTSAYAVSKVGASTLARILQREVDRDYPEKNVSVNHVHPGYVATDMSNFKGPLTIEEGAKSSLYLALEQHGLKGQMVWKDCTVVDWMADTHPSF